MEITIQQILQQQRKGITFNHEKLSQFLYGHQTYYDLKKLFENQPPIPYDFNMFNNSRVQWIKQTYRTLPQLLQKSRLNQNLNDNQRLHNIIYMLLVSMQQMPGSVHIGMFIKCIQIMGTQLQCQQFIKKCLSYEIIGAYAQTQIGHGSDVQSLQTTATFVQGKDQFIINTPTLSAAKYWPGQLGLSANWALVFAQMISRGKNYGVQSFLVPVRDQNGKPLPGIQIGDIGPKIGFHAKDNGYLILNNVVVPKFYMLRKFISIETNGQIKVKGDPKVGYATMMSIRLYISIGFPKIYSQAIIIATRYSMFRKQFFDSNKKEIKIIQYQIQQDKVVSRIAQYYAITIAGNNLKKLCDQNFTNVKTNQNFSLMNETHACLCMFKAFFSETVLYGMQILRRACGGHGFSHYSGLPSIIFQYAANVTHQGQNTILYLQTARFLLKSYKYYITKKKNLGQSVKYIDSFDYLMNKKCQVDASSPDKWALEDFRILLAQAVCYLISVATSKLVMKEEGVNDAEVWNLSGGVRLQQLGVAHAAYSTFNYFRDAILAETNQQIKSIMNDLCLLYGSNLILNYCGSIIEGGFVKNEHIASIKSAKQLYLHRLRPNIIGLVDGFGIPDKYVRSAFMKGNPYQNFLQLARSNPLNHQKLQSAIIVKNGIIESLKPKI